MRRAHRHGRTGHGRFFWRVYLNGLLLLGLVAVAVVVAGAAMGPHGPGMRPERIVEYAAAQTAEALHDPARLGEILRRARRLDEAVVELRAAVEADPGRVEWCEALGRCLAARGEIEPAIAVLEQALALPGAAADPALTERLRAELEVLRARAKSAGGAPRD